MNALRDPTCGRWRCPAGLRGTPAAFTLTELLVVIVIIALLSSLTLSGLLVARESQRASKTSSTIRKLSEVILPFYESYEWRRPALPAIPGLPTACYKELRRIGIRRLMTLELPDRASDLVKTSSSLTSAKHLVLPVGDLKTNQDLAPLLGLATSKALTLGEVPPAALQYARIVESASNSWVYAKKAPGDFTVDSVELLHMIVMRGPASDSDVVAHFRPDEMGDRDKDGLPEFLDAWGNPIAFLRWPVGFNSAVQPIAGTALGVDPVTSDKGHRLVPLIFSAGSDAAVDIGVNPDGTSAASNFDPFCYDASAPESKAAMNCFPAESMRNAVNLTPVVSGGALTFQAVRFTGGTVPAEAFQAIGCERDQNGNGVIESLDNIHNHDLTQ